MSLRPPPAPTQSFGVQAARFSLYVPFAIALINLFTRGNITQPGVAASVLAIEVLLLVAGLILGVVALVMIRRYGAAGILGRAVGGVVLNGVVLAVLVTLLAPLAGAAGVRRQVVGRWTLESPATPVAAGTAATLSFSDDGSFALDVGRDGESAHAAGRWTFARDRTIGLTYESAGPGADPSGVGKHFGLGRVKTVDAGRMVLATDKGDETYVRVK